MINLIPAFLKSICRKARPIRSHVTKMNGWFSINKIVKDTFLQCEAQNNKTRFYVPDKNNSGKMMYRLHIKVI